LTKSGDSSILNLLIKPKLGTLTIEQGERIMKKLILDILFTILCICLVPIPGLTCTTFVLNNNGQLVYGKNTEWMGTVPVFMIVNKRGVSKTSVNVPQEPDADKISWTSQFGSVTFNLIAREWPLEGINEAGLFISNSTGQGSAKDEYPVPDSRTPIGQYQWIQYQLDNFSRVDEVIASFQTLRIAKPADNPLTPQWAQHWFVSDSRGKCASIEFLDGKLVCHTGWTMPVKVLANSSYDESIAYYRKYRFINIFSPVPIPEEKIPSLLRFAVAADRVKKYRPKRSGLAVDYAFQILHDVQITPAHHTALWSMVYDSANKQLYFRSWNNDQIRWFDLNALDFSCTTPVKVIDVSADLSGDVTNSFVDYTKEIDLEMLNTWGFPQAVIDNMSAYPDSTVCTE
jgi:penicillin V acylase-like amidase (Ntn superfamily)